MTVTVAVTGPTGEIGLAAVDALERDPAIGRIVGMARRPFDASAHGWTKTEYRQGDILDRAAVEALVAGADVVIHLAYLIKGSRDESRRINLAGTRHVFEATVAAARPRRIVYTSSVAAYGYHPDNPTPLTEEVPVRGSREHYYSQQKAECEALLAETTAGTDLEVYVLRPCIVAGPRATALADSMPWRQVSEKLPTAIRRAVGAIPLVRPILPDPGVPMQLVHHDDVATAIVRAATAAGPPGAYNIAADDTVSISDVARALNALAVRVPHATAVAVSEALALLPRVPAFAEWLHVVRSPVVMDCGKARRELGWVPQHSSAETLAAMAQAL